MSHTVKDILFIVLLIGCSTLIGIFIKILRNYLYRFTYSKYQRKQIYLYIQSYTHTNGWYFRGFCGHIRYTIKALGYKQLNINLLMFPEINKYKPNKYYLKIFSFWFPTYGEHDPIRSIILEKAIEALK